MEEGGLFSWKVWKVQNSKDNIRCYNEYSKIREKLPEPKNLKWIRDEHTREWSLIPKGQDQVIVPLATFSRLSQADDEMIAGRNFEDQIGHVFEHIVLPCDTFSGICLQYKTTATKLRQFNTFSGTNLNLAPAKLLIPVTRENRHRIKAQDRSSQEFLIHLLMTEVPTLRCKRAAMAYLSMAKWDVIEAINQAREDLKWEEQNYMIFIEMNRSSREEEPGVNEKITKSNKCKKGTVPCMVALQKLIRNLVRTDDEEEKEGGKYIEMATFKDMNRVSPNLECLSDISSVAKDEIDIKEWEESLEHGQLMVHMTIEKEDTSVKQVLQNFSALLPANLSMLLCRSNQTKNIDDEFKSFELQCLIGKKGKEKIH